MWGQQQGLGAGTSPAALQVEVGEMGGTEVEAGSERARKMRQGREGQTEAQEWPMLEESQAGGLENNRRMSIQNICHEKKYYDFFLFVFREKEKKKTYHRHWGR